MMTRVYEWLRARPELSLALLGALLFVPYLGAVHLFDWDEINFAEAAREMLVTGDWLRITIDYQPFWEKPPLFIWLQALSMLAFGVNEFAARLPNALIGIVTLVVLYRIGRRVVDARMGWLWALVYAGSMLPHFYFRSGIIDPLFNLLIFLGVVQLWRGHHAGGGWRAFVYGGLWCGLAVLTKGPVALLLTGLTWGAVWAAGLLAPRGDAGRFALPWRGALLFVGASTLAAALWFGVDWARNGPWFVQTFIEYQIRLLTTGDAGHSQPFYYHPLVLLIGCFPASVFVFDALGRRVLWGAAGAAETSPAPIAIGATPPKVGGVGAELSTAQLLFARWLAWLMLVVVIVFSLVQTKILHYSSLAYFPLTGLAALTLHGLLSGRLRWRGHHSALLLTVGAVWVLALLALPVVGMLAPVLADVVKSPFTAGALRVRVAWSGLELLIGVGLGVGVGFAHALRLQGDVRAAITALLISTTGALVLILPVLVPRIEGYSQRSAIAFYEQFQGCDCYVQTLRYKSYGQYFYARRQPRYSSLGAKVSPAEFEQWVLTGPIDRPAFLLTRVQDAELYAQNPELREIYRSGGFVGFERRVPGTSHLAVGR